MSQSVVTTDTVSLRRALWIYLGVYFAIRSIYVIAVVFYTGYLYLLVEQIIVLLSVILTASFSSQIVNSMDSRATRFKFALISSALIVFIVFLHYVLFIFPYITIPVYMQKSIEQFLSESMKFNVYSSLLVYIVFIYLINVLLVMTFLSFYKRS